MNSKKFNSIMLVIGLVLLIFLLKNIDYSYVKNFNFSFTLQNVAVLIVIIFAIFAIRTFRWMLYLKSIGVNISFKDAYFIVVPSIAMALFTPAQAGDLLKVEFLKKHSNVPRRDSFATVLVEKLMDFILIFAIFIFSVIHFSLKTVSFNIRLVAIAVMILVTVVYLAVRFASKEKAVLAKIISNTKKIISDKKTMLYTFLLTLVYWLIVALNWVYVAKVVNINIPFTSMLSILSIGTVLGLISFVPGALGVMEYSTVFLLKTFMGIAATQATIFALSYRIYSIIMYVVAYVHLLFKRN